MPISIRDAASITASISKPRASVRRKLHLHPDSRCAAVTGIDVDVERPQGDQLRLRYIVSGTIGDLRLPAVGTSLRKDDLWRHTCFEAFQSAPGDAGYCEFNFAPSTEWAAYRFAGYRRGGRNLDIVAPRIEVRSDAGQFELRAIVELKETAAWRLGLAAVIEETSGNLSYWALAHAPGRPDFHNSVSFALELACDARGTR